MQFNHGNFHISVEHNIIIINMSGAFNELGIKNCIEGIKNKLVCFEKRSFCILSNAVELLGATPEAYLEIEKFNEWLNCQKLVAKAIVINSEATLEIFNIRSPSRKLQNIAIFNNEKEALNWLYDQCI